MSLVATLKKIYGFDNFLITNSPNNETSINQNVNNGLTIYPNPTIDGMVNILDFEEFISYELKKNWIF